MRSSEGSRWDFKWTSERKMEENHRDIHDLNTYIKKADNVNQALYRVQQLQKATSNKTQGQNYGIGSDILSVKTDLKGHKRWCIANKACFKCNSKEHISWNYTQTNEGLRPERQFE
jgi:hypothetical protein